MEKFNKKLAEIAVSFSVNVKKNDMVIIRGPEFAKDLICALYIEVIKRGGHPQVIVDLGRLKELMYEYASFDQLEFGDPIRRFYVEDYNKLIYIQSDDYYSNKFGSVDPEKIARFNGNDQVKNLKVFFEEKRVKGEIDFVLIPYPHEIYAKEAGMSFKEYKIFLEKALYLDKEDPIQSWRSLGEIQQKYINYLERIDKVEIIGLDTRLSFSVKGRKWINCHGTSLNLPDGEIYTGPIEDSINGYIRLTYPGIYQGKEIEDIYLEFKNGKIINFRAKKGYKLLKEIINIDGADGIGEFAIGTNYNISKFTKNMLFDEKIGGTIHIALGNGYKPTGSKSESAIHWDLLKDMKTPGSKIYADKTLIYESGKWKI